MSKKNSEVSLFEILNSSTLKLMTTMLSSNTGNGFDDKLRNWYSRSISGLILYPFGMINWFGPILSSVKVRLKNDPTTFK